MRIGLTGRIASGKSTVAKMLERLGANVIVSDAVVHELLSEPEVQRRIAEILGEDKFPDKVQIADRLFSDSQLRKRYCDYLYPRVFEVMRSREESDRPNVWEVPLLYEAGWDKEMDVVIVVSAPVDVRLARALGRGMDEEDFRRRDALFNSDAEKRADFVVDNSDDLATLERRVKEVWERISKGGMSGYGREDGC